MTPHVTDLPFWLVVLALAGAVTMALRQRRVAVQCTERVDTLEWHVRMRDEESRHLVERRLPALAAALGHGRHEPVPRPLHEGLAGTQFATNQEMALAVFREGSQVAEQSVQGLLLAVARKLQGLANGQQVKVTDMQHRHDDAFFLEDLMEVDHTNAQILRRAASIAVVCGAWPGRQHNASPLHDVVRGAIGRIMDYKRVKIVRIEDTRFVVGRVVEPLVQTLAELMENGTRLSHPDTPVQVHVQLTHSGLAFVIEDAGVGLNAAERAKALRLLNEPALGVADLGSPPRFGLATCGALARRYGYSVSVDSVSAFGGVRAVINIPKELLTESAPLPPAAPAPLPVGAVEAAVPQGRTTAHGLPKRKRQAPTAGNAPKQPSPVTHRSPGQVAAPFSAFQRASQGGDQYRHPSDEGTSDS